MDDNRVEWEEVSDLDSDIQQREALIEAAKKIDQEADWNTVSGEILRLRKRWRQIPSWDSAYEDTLREEFDRIIDTFYAKRNEAFKDSQKVKKELIERAKKLAISNEWNRATEEMNELMQQWKASGSAGKDTDDALWQQFSDARQSFFDRKHQNWEERKAKSANAAEVKRELIKEAEQLADSEEWQKTSDKFRALMDQWKAAGFAGKDTDDALWSEFNASRQKFYDRRGQYYEQLHAQQAERLQAKKAIIAEAREIVEKKEFGREITNRMKELNVEWKKIGSCGKEKEDQVWKEFRSLADAYFDGLKQWNDQRHTQWLERMQQARNRKQELIQNQKRQLRWMEQEMSTLLSQSAVDDMADQIEDKKDFIQQLEEELADLDKSLSK